jgi:hypothetical protein
LWATYARAFPNRPQGPEEREWFSASLRQLADQGVLKLPALNGRGWDRSATPATPLFVQCNVVASLKPDRSWRSFPWHPQLSWIADFAYLPQDQLTFLRRVHEGLVVGRFADIAPMKYRSLQLTGFEKRLEELTRTELFRPGRLSLGLLGCFVETLPFAWESVSDNPRIVIFENASPFAVARMVLHEMNNPPYGMVGFGGGWGFSVSIRHLATIGRPIESISYVGDMDLQGLMIPLEARHGATAAGLPQIEPATELHEAMFASAEALGFSSGWRRRKRIETKEAAAPASFLAPELRERAINILLQGNRIPEEVLGPSEMRRAWLHFAGVRNANSVILINDGYPSLEIPRRCES